MAISREDVLHVSRLARLELSEAEIEKFTGQLGDILDYISKLNELDTEGVPPTAHVLDITNVFRNDVVSASPIEGMEQMAPDFDRGPFPRPQGHRIAPPFPPGASNGLHLTPRICLRSRIRRRVAAHRRASGR